MDHAAQVFAAWREAERVLEALPVGDPDRARLVDATTRLRTAHQMLTRDKASTAIAATKVELDRSLALLDDVETRTLRADSD